MDDRLPFGNLLADLQKTLWRAGILAAMALFIGVFVPGFIQLQRGTFFRETIIDKLDSETQQKIKNFQPNH